MLAIILAVVVVSVLGQRWHGQWKLTAVKREMEKRGQVTDLKQLNQPLAANHAEFTNQFEQIVTALGASLLSGGGNEVATTNGITARGSQAPFPMTWDIDPIYTNGHAVVYVETTNTWARMRDYYAARQQSLADLRFLLQSAPTNAAADIYDVLHNGSASQFWRVRYAAQILNDSIVLSLHDGDREEAQKNLIALSALMRLHENDLTLVAQMIRSATTGIAASALWDALQAEGWTESQLVELQQAWKCRSLVAAVVQTMHVERLGILEYYEALRQSSYRSWCAPHKQTMASIGSPSPYPPAAEFFRHYVFHPIWQIAWAHEEMALCLETSEPLTTVGEEALQTQRFADVQEKWDKVNEQRKPIFAAERFYLEVPYQRWNSAGTPTIWRYALYSLAINRFFNLPHFEKALTSAAESEIRREMGATAIALKRYHLKHRRLPDQLAALVPEYLTEVPTDWMDGQPLRFVRDSDNSYLLYSVGEDGKDDGGDGTPIDNNRWPTKDIIWPKAVPWMTTADQNGNFISGE